MNQKKRYTAADRTLAILNYEPRLATIEKEIKDGTFKGDPRQLKKRIHNLIGWFSNDPKLNTMQDYNLIWWHLSSLLDKGKPNRR